jgi:hypothetical protein
MRAVALFISITIARVASAEPHGDAGVAAYQRGDYAIAAHEFELAYAANPDPKLLYAWAQAQRLGGQCDKAVELYRRYVETGPTEEQVSAATTGISLCAEQTRSKDPPPVKDEPTPPIVEPKRERPPWYTDKIGGGLVIGGVAALAVGTTFLILSSSSADAADSARTRSEFVDKLDEASSRRTIGVVGLGLGAALLAGGAIRYLTKPDDDAGVSVGVGPTSVALFGRF